jgi:[ribosomal protein S5]-alanine N-acetyltransferase
MQYSNTNFIDTPRLRLVCCNTEIIEALFEGDQRLAELLGIGIPRKWTEFGEPAFRWTYNKLNSGEDKKDWLAYLPVLRSENMLVGSCGYKGDPVNGMVEIGYEVAEDYRGKGFATEIAAALVNHAMKKDEINRVQAHTLAAENESGSILKRCGMQKMEEIDDPDDGKIWRWEITKMKWSGR